MNFRCPVCGKPLTEADRAYSCPDGHSFDRAKSGYVNLLLSQSSSGHGDDKPMVLSRRDFLAAGYYRPLMDRVAETAAMVLPENGTLLDAGCGECTYTLRIADYLREQGKNASLFGVDISKNALAASGKRAAAIARATASVYDLPFDENGFDVLLCIFSPFCGEEYRRVLKEGGKLLRVFPLERHLYGLKKAVYERPYLNQPEPLETNGFRLLQSEVLKNVIHLGSSTDILNLFTMTPYFHKTSPKDMEKLTSLSELDTETEFCIALYEKE